jgi:hypothetical protein
MAGNSDFIAKQVSNDNFRKEPLADTAYCYSQLKV